MKLEANPNDHFAYPSLKHSLLIFCTSKWIKFYCRTFVHQTLRGSGKNLQPDRLEQSHPQHILVFIANGDIVEKNPFQFEAKPAVQVDIAHVDVARVDVNLAQVPNHKSVIKEAEGRALSDTFTLQPGLTHQFFHLEFACSHVNVFAAN